MDKIINSLRPSRIIWPILIGLGVSGYLLFRNFDSQTFSFITLSWKLVYYLLLAFAMMAIRDLSYMYRIIILTNSRLSWKQAFNVIMLWEFSSAISPSVAGGTGPAIFFLYKEGLSGGRSTAVVLTAIFLDEVFFIVSVPFVYFLFGNQIFPPDSHAYQEIITAFYIGYGIIFAYTLFLAYALFINPQLFKSVISWIFLFPILIRWRLRARKSANQLIYTSKAIRSKPFSYWAKSMGATIFAWVGRYWVVNFLLLAFLNQQFSIADHLLILGRQLSMWIILLISPTPGGSGIAEFVFSNFLGDFIPNASWYAPLAIFWRFISYYPYLIIGVIVLPIWLRKVFAKKKKTVKKA
ncbi:MAG: lysylphosphatidylglycerol synthase transmembrane domain-containing protein [Bacteroidales bacterium]|nr:lysylphosphatidylglycerol synthase transmembrane domain-containing protein [Bacteroidales bacterium]